MTKTVDFPPCTMEPPNTKTCTFFCFLPIFVHLLPISDPLWSSATATCRNGQSGWAHLALRRSVGLSPSVVPAVSEWVWWRWQLTQVVLHAEGKEVKKCWIWGIHTFRIWWTSLPVWFAVMRAQCKMVCQVPHWVSGDRKILRNVGPAEAELCKYQSWSSLHLCNVHTWWSKVELECKWWFTLPRTNYYTGSLQQQICHSSMRTHPLMLFIASSPLTVFVKCTWELFPRLSVWPKEDFSRNAVTVRYSSIKAEIRS